jgi:hypothetical protein
MWSGNSAVQSIDVLSLTSTADATADAAVVCCCLCVAVCSWKTIVVNTPRTLQEILPALMAEVIDALADAGVMHIV